VRTDLTGNPEAEGPRDAGRPRTRPPGTAPPGVPGYEFEGGPRIRYTPTVSAGAPEPWPEDRPGYEFDGAFPVARRPRPVPPQAGPRHSGSHRPGPHRPGPHRPGPHLPGPGQRSGPGHRPASPPSPGHNEWSRLLRSFLPQPERRHLGREFLANLNFRGWGIRVAIPILTMVAVGVAVVVVVGANSGNGSAPPTSSLGYPPAALAGADFTAAADSRGITESLGRVAVSGSEVVAVGSETGSLIPRAEFFYSHNSGGTWAMGAVSAAGGGSPPPGYAARLVAGGQGQDGTLWAAIGPDSIWTSPDGVNWTLDSTSGLRVNVLRRTADGFIAIGPDSVYLTGNGTNWTKVAGPLGAESLQYLAVNGGTVLLSGEVSGGASGQLGALWLSEDGGRQWTPVPVPRGHGALDQIGGLATAGAGFVLVRPAGTGTDVYRSPDGLTWRFTSRLASFAAGQMNGGPAGAAITGTSSAGKPGAGTPGAGTPGGGSLAAFVSPDGSQWQRIRGPLISVSGVAVVASPADGPDVVITGASARDPRFSVLSADAAGRGTGIDAIPGATQPQVAVNAVAAQAGSQVAVGSANGFPATWISTDGGSDWTRGTGGNPAVLGRPGSEQLTSVTAGGSGWLAVGGVVAGAAQHPVVLVSPNGMTWTAADGAAAFAGQDVYTEQAAAGAGGYVIVGYSGSAGAGFAADAWYSAGSAGGGLAGWQQAAGENALDGESGGRQMLGVTATTSGFVAVGLQGNSPAVWLSPDGKTWTVMALPLPSGAARAVLLHVAAAGGTLAAVGMEQSPSGAMAPFAARSVNGGTTWTEVTLPVPSGSAQVTALAAAGQMFTATGTYGSTPGHQDVVVWTSLDGETWTAATPAGQGLAGPGIQAITGLTVSGSTLTGVGFTASPASEEPVFWQSPIR
jgi:hypothetical protein